MFADPTTWTIVDDDDVRVVLRTGLGLPTRRVRPRSWEILRSLCSQHRLDGLLVAAVALDDLDVTDEQRAEVAGIEVELTRARMWHEGRLLEATALLDSHGIESKVLKGPALARLDYPDVQMRPTGDIDLLVRAHRLDDASRALEQEGTRLDPDPIPGYGEVVGKGATVAWHSGMEVDLHRILVWGPFGVRAPDGDLWRASRSFVVAGTELSTLAVEESLLHACYHLMILGWRRALTTRDVVQLLLSPELDLDRLHALSRRWRADAVLSSAIRIAMRELAIVPGSVPLTEWATNFRPSLRDRVLLRVERPEDPIGFLEAPSTYLELGTVEARRVMRRATFRPEPDTWPTPYQRVRRGVGRLRTA